MLPYFLLVILATCFHKSIVVMIPIYFLAGLKVTWKPLVIYGGITALILHFSFEIFDFITDYVYAYYATKEGIYYMMGRDWQTAAVPVLTAVVVVALKKLLLERDPTNNVLINFSVYSALLYIMTCQHFLFQRFGIMFFTSAILLIPELLAAIKEHNSEKEQETPEKAFKPHKKNKLLKDKEHRERKERQKKSRLLYYTAVVCTLLVGFFYHLWILVQNRINLIPYLTFFQQ